MPPDKVKERVQQLQERARFLGEELKYLTQHIEAQDAWQRQQLAKWIESMASLLTFLMSLETYLEMNGGAGDDSDAAEPGGGA